MIFPSLGFSSLSLSLGKMGKGIMVDSLTTTEGKYQVQCGSALEVVVVCRLVVDPRVGRGKG
jgi:hypothetical protein